METLLLAIAVVVGVYVVVVMLLPRLMGSGGTRYTQKALDRLYKESSEHATQRMGDSASILKDDDVDSPLARAFLGMPGARSTYDLFLKSGLMPRLPQVMFITILIFLALCFVVLRMQLGLLGILIAFVVTFIGLRWNLRQRIEKRNDVFINMFPDALDMIVRSVRSGFPLNTALRMIAENMDPPVSTEFRQVVDEIAYGRSMSDALNRLAQRIDVSDIQFFVVVLTVQQEAGGNLAEIMSNLANIIRKRKQLRLKIKALTSEGRATGWVLGSLPVFVFLVLLWLAPHHLTPLFETDPGHIVLGLAIGMVLLAAWIVSQMIKIDI